MNWTIIIDDIDEYHRIRHGGALPGFVAIYRRYEHIDPKKTFAYFLATNYNDIPKAEKIADEVAEVLAGKKMESAEKKEELEPGFVRDKEKEARSFGGAYHCEEFGTDWLVEVKEEERGIWGVHLIPSDHRQLADIKFLPRSDKYGNLIFQSSYVGQIELTTDGFVYNGGKMASVHFTKKQP